jgi:hypothetical protein
VVHARQSSTALDCSAVSEVLVADPFRNSAVSLRYYQALPRRLQRWALARRADWSPTDPRKRGPMTGSGVIRRPAHANVSLDILCRYSNFFDSIPGG